MSSTAKIIAAIVVLVAFGFVLEKLVLNKSTSEPAHQADFVREGNLIKDNPGLTPGVWYLSYEEPGQTALSKQLTLDAPNTDLQSGMRVKVEGNESENKVSVSKLEVLSAYKNGLIWVDTPRPNQTVINPITINGYAKSSWYFEATFPVKVLDANGKVIGQTPAQAQGDWMSSGYVEFMASVNYTTPATATGTLVLEKDNPSGLPQNADELRIPVTFGTEGRAVKLYYYDSNKDKDASGNILCSRQGLVAVDRQIPITNTPIQDTIKLLLQGKITDEERSHGITTEYPLVGVELKGANVSGQTLTLEFTDPQNRTSGGSCRVSVLWAQIDATAKQFPGISKVKFKPAELFQP